MSQGYQRLAMARKCQLLLGQTMLPGIRIDARLLLSINENVHGNADGTYRVCEKEMSIIREMQHLRSEGNK